MKVEELEIALVEAGGVDSEAGDVDSEVGDGEIVEFEKVEKSPGVCCSNNPGEEAAWFPQCVFECARAAQTCRGPGQGHAGDPQGVSGAHAAAGVAATSGQLWACTSLVGLAMAVDLHCLVHWCTEGLRCRRRRERRKLRHGGQLEQSRLQVLRSLWGLRPRRRNSGSTKKGRAHQTGQILHLGGPALSVLLRACPLLKRSARECSAKAVEKLECSAEAVEKLECSAEGVEKLECRVKATVEGNLECFALGACCWRCPEATPYLNGSTKCLALPRCSTMRRCAAAFLGFLSKVVGFRFCLLLGVCFGATVVRWSGGFRKLVFGSRRKRACKRWVRVTLKGRIVRHSLPVKGKHSWRRVMRVLCLVRKVLEKFTAPRVRCKGEAQWTPEAERVVHRSRMLAGLPVEISVESEDELLPDPEQKPKPLNPEDPDPRPSPSGLSPPEDLEVPVYITSERLRAHRNKGHQPYLSFCDTCQSARGRVPARRRNMKSHYAPGELQVDFGFFGRNVRFLLMVHVLSGYLSTVVLGPEDPVPVPAICKALSEMGLNGLDIVVHGDQENLLESVFRDSAKHRTFVGRSMHWVPFAVNRPQAKGIVERNICLVKEAYVRGTS